MSNAPKELNFTLQGDAVVKMSELACRRGVPIDVLMLRSLRLLLELDEKCREDYKFGLVKDTSKLDIEVVGMWGRE